MTNASEIFDQLGPLYPDLPSVKKYRAPLSELSPAQRQTYGAAVEQAILAKQRSELQRALPAEPRIHCASRTNHNDGRKISAAVREQHRAALQAAVTRERRDRTPQEWQEMYQEAMQAKRSNGHAAG